MIVSEKGVRKIVQKTIDEGGFEDRGTGRIGTISKERCELDNLNNTAFATWFAKHFLFNAEGVTKKTILGSLKNLGRMGRTPDEDMQYEKAVKAAIAANPNIVKKYIEALELGITLTLGRIQGLTVCSVINTFFKGSGSQRQTTVASNTVDVKSNLESEYLTSSRKFVLENPSVRKLLLTDFKNENLFLFPRASLALASGDSDKAKEKIEEESLKLRDIIEVPNQTKNKIMSQISDYYYGISGKRIILKDLFAFLDGIEDNYKNGDIIRLFLRSQYEESLRIFSSKI